MSLRFIIYLITVISSGLIGVYHWKKLRRPYRLLVAMVLIVFVSECLTRITIQYMQSSLPLYHILVAIELVLFPLIYLASFPSGRRGLRFAIITIMVLAPLFSLLWSSKTNITVTFPSGSVLLLSLVVITCSLLGFEQMLHQTALPLWENSFFWFNLGNVIFYTVTFLVFGLANPLYEQFGGLPGWATEIVYATNLALYSCYFLSVYKELKHHGSLARP